MINIVVVDLGVKESFDAGFEAEFGVVDCTETQRRRDMRKAGCLPLPLGLMNFVRPTPKTYVAETGFLPIVNLNTYES